MVKLCLLALTAVAASPVGAEAPAPKYDVQFRVLEGTMVLGTPRLIANSGERALVTVDDGHGQAWKVAVMAAPDASAGRVSVNLRADRSAMVTGILTRRTFTTTMLVDEGKSVAITVPAGKDAPAVHIELSIRTVSTTK